MSSYEEALARGKRDGAAHCDDAAVMAWFCRDVLQLVAGAVSPKLVWQGAQIKGLTSLELSTMAAKSPLAVADLMWVEAP